MSPTDHCRRGVLYPELVKTGVVEVRVRLALPCIITAGHGIAERQNLHGSVIVAELVHFGGSDANVGTTRLEVMRDRGRHQTVAQRTGSRGGSVLPGQ